MASAGVSPQACKSTGAVMDTLLKRAAGTGVKKPWREMGHLAKVIFVGKICLMVASFGWIFGNTLAPVEVAPLGKTK